MRKTEAGSNAMFSRRCARRMNTYGCDLDGNATLARASTRTWRISCNGENHPSRFENAETQTVVECAYDCHGRRCAKKVSVAGTATRPLTFRHAEKGLMLFYAFDGNKNVSDVFFFALQNGIGAHYEYAPFGAVTRTSKATGSKVDLIGANPWRFSSEFYDSELDLVYYNYRHYSPALGRWLSRDPIPTSFVDNQGGFAVAIGGVIGGSFLVPGLIGIGIGAAVVVSAGIVVIGSAIIIDRIIDSLPKTETHPEEEAKTSDDAIPITQCPPCPDRKKRCAPCNPPVDTVMYRHDTTGRPHYVPETGKRELPHYNNYVVYQVPYKEGNPRSCECRYREIDATLVPLAGATPFRRPTGGGVIIM